MIVSISVFINNVDIFRDCFQFRTRSTIPFGWLIKFGGFFGSDKAEVSGTVDGDLSGGVLCRTSDGVGKAIFVVFDDDDDDNDDDNRFRLSTCSKIPFGWLINLGRRAIEALFLFLSGGALSALLSEGIGVEALIA